MTRPDVADLFRRYLQGQTTAQAEGLGHPEPSGEVEPYDAVPVQPVDARLAWHEAIAAATHLAPSTKTWPVPPDWPALVAAQEPAVSLAFCVGNFPQMVRDLHPLLHGANIEALRPTSGQPAEVATTLREWAMQPRDEAGTLVAAGVLRLARRYDDTAQLLARITSPTWHAVRDNEVAALAWHRGETAKAEALWTLLPESVPVLFNRGMAALFLGRADDARALLSRAVEQLPDGDSWHHLGRLYLTLASVRS
jgi:hypothetical protein